MKYATLAAQQLFQDGMLALADVEANGIRVDEEYLDSAIMKTRMEADGLIEKIKGDKIWKLFQRRFGGRATICGEQLAEVLYRDLKYPFKNFTEKKHRPKADEETLKEIDLLVVKDYLRLQKLEKMVNTFLMGIRRELVNGRLHPFFNLHTVVTYRSSSDSPNFQNFPTRDKWAAKLVRSCFVPEKGFQLLEIDFKAIEVAVAYFYHKDPVMHDYLVVGGDMHLDAAAECFLLKPDQVSDEARYLAKNRFVFPQFYGSYYVDCAKALWTGMNKMDIRLKLKDADPKDCPTVRGRLAKQGIRKLGDCDPDKKPIKGTFEYHIKEVEDHFWNQKFRVYTQWKKQWYQEYLRTGEFYTFSGFVYRGVYKRNEVLNYSVQGTAFHCLLWCLIQLNKWLKKHKMRSKIVGQIHDSVILEVWPTEMEAVLKEAHRLMTKELQKHWKWITVPMIVSAEASDPNGSWFDKKKVEIPT